MVEHIGLREQKQLLDSQERSIKHIEEIFFEVAQWRMHGLESHQKKAHRLKEELDNILEAVMPFRVQNTNSYSPPPQKRKKVAYGGRTRKHFR